MRLWSLHPKYLDSKGLVSLWREALLAQKVLLGETKGYRYHPQLERFKSVENPIAAIATYLLTIHEEAHRRNYNFDVNKIQPDLQKSRIPVTIGQVEFEIKHLKKKLMIRDRIAYKKINSEKLKEINPVFFLIKGEIENWEKS